MTELFPARYFGNIAYFRSLYHAEKVEIEQHEHFYKQQGINRYSILSANGKLELTVPVHKPFGSKTPINKVLISNQQDWKKNHLKSMESAYSSSPFFDYYGYDLEELLNNSSEDLLSFNLKSIQLVCQWLDLPIEMRLTDSHEINGTFIDHRKESFTTTPTSPSYQQVFPQKGNFVDHLSILDIIFNEGPLARNWITRVG